MGKYQIRIDQGATFRLRSYWRSPAKDPSSGDFILDDAGNVVPGPPVLLTNYTARMQIRKSISDAVKLLELTTENGGIDIPDTSDVRMLSDCKVATTDPITLSGVQTIDGVAVVVGDNVLVKNQADASTNGIYAAASGAWVRAPGATTAPQLTEGATTWVRLGTVAGDSVWTQGAALASLAVAQTWGSRIDVGRFEIVATAAQTATLLSSGVYDVELVSSSGEVARVLEGKMRLSAEVTRV